MKRRHLLRAAGGLTATATLAGCSMLGGASTGTLEARASDQPGDISDFETLQLRITELLPKPADGERTTVDIEDVTIDLTELQGDASTELGTAELETGDYEFLQLRVGEVVEATLSEGGEANVTTPGEAPLKFNRGYEICEGGTTTFTADFTPVKRGQGGYILQPVADEVTVESTCDEDGATATNTTT